MYILEVNKYKSQGVPAMYYAEDISHLYSKCIELGINSPEGERYRFEIYKENNRHIENKRFIKSRLRWNVIPEKSEAIRVRINPYRIDLQGNPVDAFGTVLTPEERQRQIDIFESSLVTINEDLLPEEVKTIRMPRFNENFGIILP